ncbi:hypothetical protein OH807_28510 [Kitasatospora sp. NBC_01560]|uniref:hypothetical protein n=1 Tax=Kitasatospora sp. NBC_01560 TaxID=2975965 RepID=UPI003869B51D
MRPVRIDPVAKLPGYGVRWDAAERLYRVCDEVSGEWLCEASGELAGFSSFFAAESAYRAFGAHRRVA